MALLLLLVFAGSTLAHSPIPLTSAESNRLLQARTQCSSRSVHCILAHEATEGPFYVAHPLIRSNLTEDRHGIRMALQIDVLDVGTCKPVPDVFVDIWHCDAKGVYSGWASRLLNSASPPMTTLGQPVDDTGWLRGIQPTNERGLVTFQTVWPGWYPGRSTHVHLRIHNGNSTVDHGVFLGGGKVVHTGQLFFDDNLVKNVSRSREPYKSRRKGLLPRMNSDDGIYINTHGAEQTVTITESSNVLHGSVTVGINPNSDNPPDGIPGNGIEAPTPPHPGPGRDGQWVRGVMWTFLICVTLVATWFTIRLFCVRKRVVMARIVAAQKMKKQPEIRVEGETRSEYGTV